MTPEARRLAIVASSKHWAAVHIANGLYPGPTPKTWVPGVNMKEWLGLDLDTAEFTGLLRPEIEKEMWRRKSQK